MQNEDSGFLDKYSYQEIYSLNYLLRKKGRESAVPQPAPGKLNSRIIRIIPMMSPIDKPQNAPGSVVRSQNIAITNTTAIGGHKKLLTELV